MTAPIVDESITSTVIVCSCGDRLLRATRAAAWVAYARHLKHVHGDVTAAATARRLAARIDRRTHPPAR